MNNVMTIARREFSGYFNGPIAYIVICLVLLVLGIFFWPQFFLQGRASVRDMFHLLGLFLLFAAPAMSMGLLAEEKRTGTIEILITMPVRDWEIVVGKYLGVLGLFSVLLLLTLPYPITVSIFGSNMDWGPVFTGYLGLYLYGGAMLALGLLASSVTDNQLIALFIALAICLFFWAIHLFVPFLPSGTGDFFQWISLDFHFRSIMRGVIDTRDVLYFLSVIALSLMISFRSLESRRWS